MRKVFICALALVSFGPRSPATAESKTVIALCSYAQTRCVDNCLDEKNFYSCSNICDEKYLVCMDSDAQIQIRGFSKGSSKGNLKDFPVDGKLKAHGAPSGGGMSTMQGGVTAPTTAASGPVSTPPNPKSSSSISKPAAGGNGLFSGPGTPRLRAQ